jgi:hypothetical protein
MTKRMTDFIEVPRGRKFQVPRKKKKFQVPKEDRIQADDERLGLFVGTWNFLLGT